MNEPQLIQLRSVEVEGLFGIYDHRVDLNQEDRVTLLHGPNGVGKTHTLGMINALLGGDTSYFRRVPCKRFRLTFANSAVELVVKSTGAQAQLTLTQGGDSETAEIRLRAEADDIATPYLPPPLSEDLREGELSSEGKLLGLLARRTPTRGAPDSGLPPWFQAFLENASVHFIETQRLVRSRPNPRAWSNPWANPRLGDSAVSTVLERSREFGERLRETMASYGRQAQVLDQTFPQRLVAARDSFANEQLEQRMTALKRETDLLESLGILDEASEQPSHRLDVTPELDDPQAREMTARVMTLYVEDTEQKLEALADLSRRVRSLLDSINGKFRHKRLRVDREGGFVAETDSSTKLPLSSLSSGEQHELVLHYDLLFRVRRNTIVLIDEPELSLHVSWQKRFLPDLLEFAKLSAFDAIVATHSPYIIGERDDLMVGLGDQI